MNQTKGPVFTSHYPALKRRANSSSAASMILLLFVGLFSCKPAKQPSSATSRMHTAIDSIMPQRLKVELVQANGHILSFWGNGDVQDTTHIPVGISSLLRPYGANYDTAYNILRVPKGETYAVALSDGTSIYLDAGTCIKFPLVFHGSKREIFLVEGQIYCKVTTDHEHPFVVRTSKDEVVAPGNAFNVSLTGGQSVISSMAAMCTIIDDKGRPTRLSPGQQAVRPPGGKPFVKTSFSPVKTLSWLRGSRLFTNATLAEVCSTIDRVYNLPVITDSLDLHKKGFNGILDKSVHLDSVLTNLCDIGGMRWYIDQDQQLHFSKGEN
ncbi:DUF4974 domain-containing protein [Chitinophaga agrisoli]|uniref:DUF4974 domain-containing protein n=1 Tax=Chitinophaga agrisoli TaxID=2607653 RepID=A0A5B2VMW6_9BACT|nr:FecR family protein [Chitinophaga agrisoli]KAA2239756.1 DUF4974 domain-containing protein [Chitinophaga agrisoli]